MIQLPIEIFPIIFKHVEFIDLIKLREVCRLFRNIIDDKDYNLVDELCVNVSSRVPYSFVENKFWSLLDEKRLIKNKTNLNKFNLENKKLFKTKLTTSKILINLKYLKIYFDNERRSNILMHLCYFTKLEVLGIVIVDNEYSNDLKIIHLNLIKLSIRGYESELGECFEINCPQLTTFLTDCKLHYYDIVYPEKIKCLRFYYYSERETSTYTDQFINIEYLVIEYFFGLKNIELKNLKKIKELKLILDFDCYRFVRKFINRDLYEAIKVKLIDLLEQKINLNKTREDKIKLFLNDEELNDEEQIKMILNDGFGYNFSDNLSDSSENCIIN